MVPHPHDDGPVERGVSLSMTAAVEAVAARCHPGRSRDGAGPAELGEGGFRMNPIGVVAKDDQHLGGGVGTDAQALTQRRRGLGGESTQVTVVVHDLDMRSKVHPQYTTKDRVGNWSAYEQALVQRGDVTLWADSLPMPRTRGAWSGAVRSTRRAEDVLGLIVRSR